MKKVVVNTRLLQKNRLEGIGTFMDEILKRIVINNPNVEFHFLFNKPFDQSFIYGKNVIPHVVPLPLSKMFLLKFWNNSLVPIWLRRIKADCYISMDSTLMSTKLKIPSHYTLHDINFIHRPEDLPSSVKSFYNIEVPKYIENATKLATVSNYSKNDICNHFNISKEKVYVIYNASKDVFKPISILDQEKIKEKYSQKKDYFLYVGSLHPRKNLKNLLLGFEEFKNVSNSELKLIVVGAELWKNSDISVTMDGLKSKHDILFLGRVSDNELNNLLASALALTFIPLFEGFGIPILEAFATNTPVITSNTTSLPEVAGKAALLVNPEDINEIGNAMLTIWNNGEKDNDLTQEMIIKGKDRLKLFSWDESAIKFWESVKSIL